jgi:hypothetical protein
VIGVLVIIAAVTVVWYSQPKIFTYTEDFEEDFGGWIVNADVPVVPNKRDFNGEWNVSRVTYLAQSGQDSVKLYIDGIQDDGTVWIEKGYSVRKNVQIQVTVSFDFYSEIESFNVIAAVVGFAGKFNPEVEADFAVIGQAN